MQEQDKNKELQQQNSQVPVGAEENVVTNINNTETNFSQGATVDSGKKVEQKQQADHYLFDSHLPYPPQEEIKPDMMLDSDPPFDRYINSAGKRKEILRNVPNRKRYGRKWKLLGYCSWILLIVAFAVGIYMSVRQGKNFVPGLELSNISSVNLSDLNKSDVSQEKDGTETKTKSDPAAADRAKKKLDRVVELLRDYYYRDLTDEEIYEAMAAGVASKMDSKFTGYLTAEENAASKADIAGEYSGIGAVIQGLQGTYTIVDLVDNSPASESGVQVHDVITKVDGKDVTELKSITELTNLVKGKEGTEVKLTVFRPSHNKELELTLKRAKITNADIRTRTLISGIPYIRVTSFDEGVSKNFEAAISKAEQQGAKKVVIDLRSNPGGLVKEVVAMLDYLLPEGKIIEERGRDAGMPYVKEEKSDAFTGVSQDMQFYILTNKYTASASELFSGTLRDYKRATLIGENTYGKGVGTLSLDLEDGSAVNITNFYYYLPNGENIQDKGLAPDYEVTLSDEVAGYSVGQLTDEQDAQLQKALELITGKTYGDLVKEEQAKQQAEKAKNKATEQNKETPTTQKP